MSAAEQNYEIVEQAPVSFEGCALESAFQPIFSLGHRRTVGYEALIRAKDAAQAPVSPPELFASCADQSRLLALDEACQALHVRNFAQSAPECRWLFLNLDAATITQKTYRDGMLADALGAALLEPGLLVIEILEADIEDEALLVEAVDYFRSLGALVALDDFGAGCSNFDRIWRLAPDIIKLDRALIVEAEQHRSGRLRQVLPNLVALMHEAGSLVLAEGIETDAQALVAMDADVDFVQGFYFARPASCIERESPRVGRRLDLLGKRFAAAATARDQQQRRDLAPYIDAFRVATAAIEDGATVESGSQPLLRMPRTTRCYLLDERGEELVRYSDPARVFQRTRKAGPIADSSGGNWVRRQYFREALSEPRRVKRSRTYMSSTENTMCITLSVAYNDSDRRVFCCDVCCQAPIG